MGLGTTPWSSDDLLSVEEVAHRCAVDRSTVRRWIAAGKLPACRLGDGPSARIRIARSDLERFIMPAPAP
jgi:excisionase family DNA binding protein